MNMAALWGSGLIQRLRLSSLLLAAEKLPCQSDLITEERK
jgi:hypothetical protein